MRRLVVLGGGTAGTVVANKLRRRLTPSQWEILVVDQDDEHLYQPGLLLVPFGRQDPAGLRRARHRFLAPGVEAVYGTVERVMPEADRVVLADGRRIDYDHLVIATGASPHPEQTEGLPEGMAKGDVFDFYTLDGALALRDRLSRWPGGRLVVHIVEMPIKCPVAPLEFAFLADEFFRDRGIRDSVDLTYVTPLDGPFTKPLASRRLGGMLEQRRIRVEGDFMVEHVDAPRSRLVSFDGREIAYDLLVTVPLTMGADFVGRSGLGDDLNYVRVDKHTLLSRHYPNIFAIGDACDIPASKAGSVAHFSAEVFAHNFVDHVAGRTMARSFDGHANCFVESGNGKGLLIDFNYETEPLPGRYPIPRLGPFSLLSESRRNHWGKLGFQWAYWHLLLPGRPLPVPALMSMAGKEAPLEEAGHAGH